MKDRKKNTIIRIKGLTKRYDTVLAVDNLSLNIREGEIFGLLGPNGAGKTTTTLMLLGLTEPSSGQAFIDGNDCTRNPIEVKKTVGYLPDSVGFYPDLTGRENLIFTGMLNGLDREESGQRAERLLERVGMSYAADEGLRAVIEGIRGVGGLQEKEEKGNFRVEADRDIRRELTAGLAENGYAILELHQKGGDLDEIYRRYFEKAGEQDEISGGRKKRSIIKGFWRRKEGTPRE